VRERTCTRDSFGNSVCEEIRRWPTASEEKDAPLRRGFFFCRSGSRNRTSPGTL